ncbi:hypothetical protein JOF48_000647 [Arthrobacter stackebrandtii]|uniref:Tetratricopeptide repeat protein n=1 Tax=Arthrobacter stackebrandtii TaxID=272161 RepID=A0ABS4YST4_9MICC|nr:hypothetical protein [Arthrobacter stackebrandtii]MBP2411848.1 hypothetical protein [Arthrobacter stackebrandtii]PYG99120.1 hypothetical protein CVV67_17145 [Arthrobacter stackebrandtii]
MSSEELEDLIAEATETNWGAGLDEILDKALALAVEQGDESGEYRVRLQLGNNAQMTGDTDRLLSNFAWCLAKHDEDPVRFPNEPDPGSDLMWQFKWMVGALGADPQFSTEQIDAVMADMDAHYRRAGLGLSGVATARFESAFQNGHLDQARTAFETVQSTSRDEYSHCDACVRSVAMDYHFSTGEVDRGIAEFTEIMEGGLSCAEEPENAMSTALVPLLRKGDVEGLASLHRRSYRDARGNADNIGIIANHIAFCAITGNEARGLALAERHLAWLAHDVLSHRSHMGFLTAVALLLDKVDAAGHGDIPVRGSGSALLTPFFGQRSGDLTAVELAPLCWAAADALAADFDTRNGNDWHARLVAARREMAAESHELSLGTESFAPPAPRAGEEPRTGAQWRQHAVDLASTGQSDAAMAACASGLRSTDDPREAAALHGAVIGIIGGIGDERNLPLLREAVALRAAALREAGEEELAGLAERTAELLAGPDDEDTNAGKLDAIDRELQALSGHAEAKAELFAEKSMVLMGLDRIGQARAALAGMDAALLEWDAAPLPEGHGAEAMADARCRARAMHSSMMLRLAIEDGNLPEMRSWLATSLGQETSVVRRASAIGLRARLKAQDGDLPGALSDAEESTELLLGLGAREAAAQSTQLSAAILNDMGRTEEFRARLRFGIQQAQLAESPHVLGLAHSLARDLVEHGSHDEAVELLDETLNGGLEIGDHDRGELFDLLGNALRGAGELGGALNAWELGVDSFAANGEADRVAQLHLAASSLCQGAGHHDMAARSARAAVDSLNEALKDEAPGIDPELLIAAHMQLAEALSMDDDEAAEGVMDAAAMLAVQADSPVQAAEIQLIRARHLFRAGDVDAAVANALQASSALETLEDAGQQSVVALLQAAHMLDNAKRHDDAVAIYHSVIDELEGDAQGLEIVRHQLADCLESAGRSAEALAVRAEAEAGRQK